MTSPYERPDRAALADLGPLVEALGQELASWRSRALKAEVRPQEPGSKGDSSGNVVASVDAGRVANLEAEATELRRRLDRAREQVDMLRTRLRFLEERTEGAA